MYICLFSFITRTLGFIISLKKCTIKWISTFFWLEHSLLWNGVTEEKFWPEAVGKRTYIRRAEKWGGAFWMTVSWGRLVGGLEEGEGGASWCICRRCNYWQKYFPQLGVAAGSSHAITLGSVRSAVADSADICPRGETSWNMNYWILRDTRIF